MNQNPIYKMVEAVVERWPDEDPRRRLNCVALIHDYRSAIQSETLNKSKTDYRNTFYSKASKAVGGSQVLITYPLVLVYVDSEDVQSLSKVGSKKQTKFSLLILDKYESNFPDNKKSMRSVEQIQEDAAQMMQRLLQHLTNNFQINTVTKEVKEISNNLPGRWRPYRLFSEQETATVERFNSAVSETSRLYGASCDGLFYNSYTCSYFVPLKESVTEDEQSC